MENQIVEELHIFVRRGLQPKACVTVLEHDHKIIGPLYEVA